MPLFLAIINQKNGCTEDFPLIYNLSGFDILVNNIDLPHMETSCIVFILYLKDNLIFFNRVGSSHMPRPGIQIILPG